MHNSKFLPIKLLLNKANVIDFQYRKEKNKDSFNIFNLLSRKFDEVNIHSRFLFELLNPDGSHGLNRAFLELFLRDMQIMGFSLDEVRVRREYRNIDLLITNKNQAIIIENKLWANDRWEQLQGYYLRILNEGFKDIRVVYLSLDGKNPEEYSIGTLPLLPNWQDIFYTISYESDLNKWLENCIKEAYDRPTIRETLKQYRLLVNEITGKTMNTEERDEIINLIAEDNNILYAKKIAENWNHIRWFTEWWFWTELEEKISLDYRILDLQKYDSANLDSVVHHGRNRNPWYGIMIKIGEYLDSDACIFIERGQTDVYYGLTLVKNNHRLEDTKFQALANKLEDFSDWGFEGSWIAGNYCEPKINFGSFSNETTLKLINETFRNDYINNLWVSMKEYIVKVQRALLE